MDIDEPQTRSEDIRISALNMALSLMASVGASSAFELIAMAADIEAYIIAGKEKAV